MDQLLQSLQETANKAAEELKNNTEWITRYAGYASEIMEIQETIKDARKLFHERKPLYVYSSISRAKNRSQVTFNLRYRGQSVAEISYKKGKLLLKTNKNTKEFYGIEGGKTFEWNSKEAEIFRGGFAKCPDRINKRKKNEEHRFESALLTELSKNKGSDKVLTNIQPVRLVESRFQMPTPFKASGGQPAYIGHKGGGIDLLCRTKHGNKSVLNIFELKDEYEDHEKVLQQAVIYSVFIHKLLRSPDAGSNNWWKLFGFSKIPNTSLPLRINAVIALPKNEKNVTSFKKEEITVNGGTIQLHYLYFTLSKNDKVGVIETSLMKN